MSNNTVIINDTTPRVQYAAAGGVTDFSFDFAIFDKDDLRVWLDDDLQTSGYSVVLDEDKTGRVAFDAAPEAGTLVTLVRDMAYDQHADFTAVGNLRREVLHNELSRVFAMIQQVAYKIAKTVAVSDVSNSDPAVLVGDIEVLYGIREEIERVAAVADSVDVCSDNIEAIKAAPTYAADAHASLAAAVLAEASAADSRDKAAASEASAAISRADASASAETARSAALDAVRRNVGDVFYTTRSDDALNGAVECDGAAYQCADFAGENAVPALLAAGKLPYVGITDFDACVTANGACRAFGWDGAGAAVFKVPKLSDVYIQAGTAAVAGEFVGESLPNITGKIGGTVRYRAMVQLVTGAADAAVVTATTVLPRMNRLEQRFQIVSALPAEPDPETFYFVVKGE